MGSKVRGQIYTIYLILLIATLVLKILGFSLLSIANVTFYVVFLVITGIMLLTFYREPETDISKRLVLIALPLTPIFLIRDPILHGIIFIAIVSVVPFVYKSRTSKYLKGLAILTYALAVLISGLLLFLNVIFYDFGADILVSQKLSPSGKYNLKVIDVDQGALGLDTVVRVERRFGNVAKWERRLSVGEGNPKIEWKQDNEVEINGRTVNIFYGSI